MEFLKVYKLSDNASLPIRGSDRAAGCDLFSAEDSIVSPKSRKLIKTDIIVIIQDGYYGRIAPRSGLAVKNFIDVGAGVIDSDYRGNVGILLFNFGDTDFIVKKHDKIAQLIIEQIAIPKIVEIFDINTDITSRGSNGFGSTGV